MARDAVRDHADLSPYCSVCTPISNAPHSPQHCMCPRAACIPQLAATVRYLTHADCIPGTYASCSSGVCQCIRCPRDSWCPGGLNSNNVRPTSTYDSTAAAGLSAAVAVPCGQGLTTRLGVVARYSSQCGKRHTDNPAIILAQSRGTG